MRELTLDLERNHQLQVKAGRCKDVPRHLFTMSRHMTFVHPTGQYPKKYPQVEGLPVILSQRHAKIRRAGYRRHDR